MRDNSRKAVKRGTIRCAPACGMGCTEVEYQQAHKNAKRLLAKMLTKGWKIRVWENLGWHYKIQNGYMFVSPDSFRGGGERYFAGLATEIGAVGTPSYWHKSESFSDPNRAVASQLARAAKFGVFVLDIVAKQRLLLGKKV